MEIILDILQKKLSLFLAFDYSEKMVELAKKRQKRYADNIEFCVADATNETSLMALKRNKPFTKAVSNMAVMDITDIKPLFTSVYKLLEDNGVRELLFFLSVPRQIPLYTFGSYRCDGKLNTLNFTYFVSI